MPHESSIAYRRGFTRTCLWGVVGCFSALAFMFVVTVFSWLQYDTPASHRQVHLRWLRNDAPGPMLVCGALMACAAAATYFPKGRHSIGKATAFVVTISLAVWVAEAILIGDGGERKFSGDLDAIGVLASLVWLLHAPMYAAGILILIRAGIPKPSNQQDAPIAARSTLAKFEPVIALACLVVPFVLFLPAKVRSVHWALRSVCGQNLERLAVAAHDYEMQTGHPLQDICDPQGQPLLSWRVALLPFLNETDLMKEFHLDEPWDSPNNAELLRRRPDLFACPSANPGEGFTSYYLVNDDQQRAIVETENPQIPWTKPDEVAKDAKTHRPTRSAHPGVYGRVRLDQFPLPEGKTPEVEWIEVEELPDTAGRDSGK